MKIATSKIRKWLIISVAIGVGIFLLAIIFISPITKYLIEKYDEQITGRRITLDWAYVNPFTGYFYLHNLKIYEYKSDSIFISISGLNANIALLQLLLKRELEIGDINLFQPNIIITQSKHNFNFDDLIIQFSPK